MDSKAGTYSQQPIQVVSLALVLIWDPLLLASVQDDLLDDGDRQVQHSGEDPPVHDFPAEEAIRRHKRLGVWFKEEKAF